MTIKPIDFDASSKDGSSSLVYTSILAVKELLDNAIDSGAKNIYIDIDEWTGGHEYIKVRDDGPGIDVDDRKLMCLNCTTSKISNLQEIAQVRTLGFRGQALFSLASLLDDQGSMEVITKCKKDIVGERWSVNKDGSVKNSEAIRIPYLQGTPLVLKGLLAAASRPRNFENSNNSLENIFKCKILLNHYSLEYRSIRFYFYLIYLGKNGIVVKRKLQQFYDTQFTRVEILSSIAQLKNIPGNNFIEEEGIFIDKFTRISVILPRTLLYGDEDFANTKNPRKFLSFNGRPLSLECSLGKSVNTIIGSIYQQLQLFDPMVWYLNFHIDMRIADVNVDSQKFDVLMKDVDYLLDNMRRVLLDYIIQELNLEVHKQPSLTAEEQTQTNSHFQIKRPLTAGSMVSNEAEWTHTLLDDEDLNSQEIEGDIEDLSSSFTYNYKASPFENEDLEISNELSVSNPFMIAKLRKALNHSSCNCRNEQAHLLPTEKSTSLIKKRENLIDVPRRMIKNPKSDKGIKEICENLEFEWAPEDTTLVSAEEDRKGKETKLKRSIFGLSEFTNHYTTNETFEIPYYSLHTYDQEWKWLLRRGIPSEYLITYIRSRSNESIYSTEVPIHDVLAKHEGKKT
ncbi:hypothetical protein ZYGM_003813 [Zygosaccharomyces mellis]|uniref:Uncharacterized protein n=1 Tax=Zygosaccharomyces mellis TaxID=42258 RepID=A0A4C2E2C8_9SACH|nr:hypothetical protein ZYGM_003813 [Zygosaccharomyces mellis]